MLNLQLRPEFLTSQTPGTAIALDDVKQRPPSWIQEITYPTTDIQNALKAISATREGRPIVLMGDRGRGKSHIMAVMHHAISSPDTMELWARDWGNRVGSPTLASLSIQRGYQAISEAVHNQEYPLLWNLIFDRHPRGQYYKGEFEASGNPFPARSLLERMFKEQPVALILDEFQKWFDGLHDDPAGRKWQTNASNFVQILSELSKDKPEHLILVISVLNNQTEAFKQVHRNTPVVVDFRGPTARQDRQRLLLHRLFMNRGNIPQAEIRSLVNAYASERFRLRYAGISQSEQDRITDEVVSAWPFAPELLELLEDQILMAEAAQETRDLIRILAQVYRARGKHTPVITPADFFVDDDSGGVTTLLDSIATAADQEKLRAVAQRNLESITSASAPVPHARELVSALWMRSLSSGKNNGATRQELQLDITRSAPQDDNAFRVEWGQLEDHAPNIHGGEIGNERLRFELEENPTTRVRTIARNNKLWEPGAIATIGSQVFPGEDISHIRKTFRSILSPEAKERPSRIIVLGPNWQRDPWKDVDEADQPARWDRLVLLVIPDPVTIEADGRILGLGEWLKAHVSRRRNTVRLLLLGAGTQGIYTDQTMIQNARGSFLTSIAWKDDGKYRALKDKFDKPLRDSLKTRFDRFAILQHWDFQNPAACRFTWERVNAQGEDIPAQVEVKINDEMFDFAPFENYILDIAKDTGVVGDVLDYLYEPPSSPAEEAIPFLGDTRIYERIMRMAADGKVALNVVGGAWIRRLTEHSSSDQAYNYVKGRAFRSGSELRAVQIALPDAVGGTTVAVPTITSPQPAPTPETTVAPGSTSPSGVAPIPGGEQPPVVVQPVQPDPVPTPRQPVLKTQRTDDANTSINLAGKLESWNVPSGTRLTTAKLEFGNLTVQELKQILTRIPSSLRALLEISYNEEDES